MATRPPGVRAQAPVNPFSSLVRTDVSRTDPLTYRIQQPTTPAPGTSYADLILQQVFGVQSPVRAQKVRKLDPKAEQWVAANSENMTRNRPEFIRQAMLSGNPALMELVSEGFRNADAKVRLNIGQEIAERFPNPRAEGGVAIGWSPEAQEVIDFLKTGQVSLERAEQIDAVRQLEDSAPAPSQRRGLPGGEVAQEFELDPDAPLDFSPETNVVGLPSPGDPVLDAGVREFGRPEGMGEGLRTSLDARPGTRAGKSKVSADGDKVNPKKERFTTQMVKGPDGKLIPVRQAQGDPVYSPQDNPAINAANRGRRPYPTRDYEAERSLKSEQQILADNLAAMWNGDPGAAERVWSMVKLNTNQSPVPPSAEGLVDYALSLITDQDALARAFAGQSPATARAQMINVANRRFFPEGETRTRTPEQVAADDAAFDAEALDPSGEMGYTPDVPREVTPEQMAEYQARREQFERAVGRRSYLDPSVPLAVQPAAPRPVPPPTPLAPGGNVGRAGAPKSLRESQVDAFPQGLDQNLRPVSAIEGRGPRKGSKANKDVDAVGGRENLTERSQRDPVRLRGEEQLEEDPFRVYTDEDGNAAMAEISPDQLQQKALRNSTAYAHNRGKVVFEDAEGNVIAQAVNERLLEKYPNRVNAIRSGAMRRMVEQSGDPDAAAKLEAEFNYMWPEGGLPLPQYFDWANSVDPSSPRGLTPEQEAAMAGRGSEPPRVDDTDKINRTLEEMRQSDADEVERARQRFEEMGVQLDGRVPPGFVTRSDGRVVRSRFSFDEDDFDGSTPEDFDGSMPEDFDVTEIYDPVAEAWTRAPGGQIIWDGDEVYTAANAPAEVLARHVSEIIADPNSSPMDLQFARDHYAATRDQVNAIPDPELRQMAKEILLDPLDQAAAARRAAEPGNVTDDLDAAGADSELTDALDAIPDDSESATVVIPIVDEPIPGQRSSSTASVGEPDAAAISEAADALDDVNANLDAAASPVDAQPSAQSADNAKPQEPPKADAEAQSRANADAQKQASDAESAKGEEVADDDWDPNYDPYAKPGPTPQQDAPTRGRMRRMGEWAYRNKGRLALGAAGLAGAAGLYNRAVTSVPFPGALDAPPAGGGEEAMTPEQRIRMLSRQRSGPADSNPYPRQTLWRVY